MRVIKFRAWIGEYKRFADSVEVYSDGSWGYDIIIGGNSEFFSGSENDNLIQFTGLTDKNGVDIYEDDHIELHGNKNGFVRVLFKNAYVGGWVLIEGDNEDNYVSLGARNAIDLEVIGNIYEPINRVAAALDN